MSTFSPLLALGEHGIVGATRNSDTFGSFSLRLVKPYWALNTKDRGSVGLVAMQAKEPDLVSFPGPEHFRQYLASSLQDWVNEWDKLLINVAPQWRAATRRKERAELSVKLVTEHSDAFSGVYKALTRKLLAS